MSTLTLYMANWQVSTLVCSLKHSSLYLIWSSDMADWYEYTFGHRGITKALLLPGSQPAYILLFLQIDHVPMDFLLKDTRIDAEGCHLIFATKDQLRLLPAGKSHMLVSI